MSIGDVMSLPVNTRMNAHSYCQKQQLRGICIDAKYCPHIEGTFPGDAVERTEPESEGLDLCIGYRRSWNRITEHGFSTMNVRESSPAQQRVGFTYATTCWVHLRNNVLG